MCLKNNQTSSIKQYYNRYNIFHERKFEDIRRGFKKLF